MRIFKKLSALICLCLVIQPLVIPNTLSSVLADEIPQECPATSDLDGNGSKIRGDESNLRSGKDEETVYLDESIQIQDISDGYAVLPKECIALLEKGIESLEDQVVVSELRIPCGDHTNVQSDMHMFNANHPKYFYANVYSYSYSLGTGYVTQFYITYEYEKDQIKTMKKEVEQVVSEALSHVKDSMSDYQKALVLHDWLAYHTAYAYERLENHSNIPEDFSCYGALVNKEAVCEGYADAYSYLLSECGIKSYKVSNDSMSHAWNVVRIGSSYYNVDVTWDDPAEDMIGYVRHIYLLVDNQTMLDRSSKSQPHEGADDFDASKLTSKTYVNAKWVGVNSPITFYKNEWYYSGYNESKYYALLYKTSDILTSSGTVFYEYGSSTGRWVIDDSSFWPGSYSYPMLYANYLIFNTNQSICYFDLDSLEASPEVMYEASKLSGVKVASGKCIFGFKVDRDTLYYSVNTEPSKSEIKSVPNLLKAKITDTPTPTKKATVSPTVTKAPSGAPTKVPSGSPTKVPSGTPTKTPSKAPTVVPTDGPTKTPSKTPSKAPTAAPGTPTPTTAPGKPTPTTAPGKPTPTTAPGKLTPTTVPGQPTPTTAPGQPTPTTVPGQPTPTTVPGQPTPTTVPRQPTPTTAPSSGSIADFVERLYTVALGRPSEKAGKDFWVKEITSGNRTGADCAREFLFSQEFANRNLSIEDFVETLYQTFFGRDSEPNGKAYWVGELKNGTKSRNDVINGFIDSTEWCNICADYGVRSGAPSAKAERASKNAIDFATRLYTCCLGRAAEAGGLKYWSLALTNLEQTGCSAAKEFFKSQEFTNLNLKTEEYIKRLYTTFMDREPESSEVTYWAGEIAKGTQTRDSVLAFFGQSEEFTNICKRYGIERGTI